MQRTMRVASGALVVGMAVGAGVGATLAQWMAPECAAVIDCPEPSHTPTQAELKLLQTENRMLLAMVKAGLSGDISGHIRAFSAMQSTPEASAPSPQSVEADAPAVAVEAPQASQQQAGALVERLVRADKQLQKQALAEGWATDPRLQLERQNLWEQARQQLSESDYLQATHAGGQPNVLLVESARAAGEPSEPLQYGDLLLAIDGQRVFTRSQYNHYLSSLPDSPIVTLEVQRQRQRLQLTLVDPKLNLDLYADSVKGIR